MKLAITTALLCFVPLVYGADTVHVATSAELLNEIASDKVIMLDPGVYNISATDPTLIQNQQVVYSNENGYTAKGVKNLIIEGIGTSAEDVSITSSNVKQHVLGFLGCADVVLKNISGAHDNIPEDNEMAEIWLFNQCSRIKVQNNTLNSGSVGIKVTRCKEVELSGSKINQCVQGFIDLVDSWTLRIMNNQFTDNSACSAFWFMSGCMDVRVEDCLIENNVFEVSHNCRASKLFAISRSEMVIFQNNIIRNNETRYLGTAEATRLIQSNNTLKRNKFKEMSPVVK